MINNIIKENMKMTDNLKNNTSQRSLVERTPLKLKEEDEPKEDPLIGFNNLHKKNVKKESPIRYCVKNSSSSLKNSITFCKAQTKSREIDKRYDIYGNLIEHRGKQKVSFIDCVTKNSIFEVIKVDNFKEYNKMEEVSPNSGNGCCLII